MDSWTIGITRGEWLSWFPDSDNQHHQGVQIRNMATNTYAQKTIVVKGPNITPQQAVRNTKRLLETLRGKFVSIGRAIKDVTLHLTDRVLAVETDLKDLKSFEADIESSIQRKKELEDMIQSKEQLLNEYFANPGRLGLPEITNKLPDDIGQLLLTLTSAYWGTETYIGRAVAHSQQLPGDDITGPIATELARRLEAHRIDHEMVLSERDQSICSLEAELASVNKETAKRNQTIGSLQTDLALAKEEAAASVSLAQERDVALKNQAQATGGLRKSQQEASRLLQAATKELDSLKFGVQVLTDEKNALATEVGVTKTRLSTAEQLCDGRAKEVHRLTGLLTRAEEKVGKLTVNCSSRDETIRTLETSAARAESECAIRLSRAGREAAEELALKHKDAMDNVQARFMASADSVSQLQNSLQHTFDRLEKLQQRLDGEVSSHAVSKCTLSKQADQIATLTREKGALSTPLEQAKRQLSVCQTRVLQLEKNTEADNENIELLQKNAWASVDALAGYFANACAAATNPYDNGWVAFAQAAHKSRFRQADGDFPGPLWTILETWDAADEVAGQVAACPPDHFALELYGALHVGVWTNQLAKRIALFTDAMTQTSSINVSVIKVLAEAASQVVGALDAQTVTPTAYMCGLGIWQALAVLQARWSQLLPRETVDGVASRLRSLHVSPFFELVADIVIGGSLAQSPHRLDQGHTAFLSQHDTPVSFIVDTACCSIRAVSKRTVEGTRSVWEDSTTLAVRAPRGQENILIECNVDSQEVFDWLVWHWLS